MADTDSKNNADNADLFVEQAEYIESTALLRWSTEHPEEELIIRKLSQGGAKLITGPRGCGKTTLLLKTYQRLCDSDESSSLPIYVNFKSSLKLEPLYRTQANAVYWFNQWLLFKVYEGLQNTLEGRGTETLMSLRFDRSVVNRMIDDLESGRTDLREDDTTLSFSILEEDIRAVLDKTGKMRCVLLLDDAAHAFSTEQQRDFFDFFRKVKSRTISPKAAIYPGVTIFSSTFHLGHDAEEIDVWVRPDGPGYLQFMFRLLERRLPAPVYAALASEGALLSLVCYSAFGMPRAMLNMIRPFYREDTETCDGFNRARVLGVIRDSLNNALAVFRSLRTKLPMYENFVLTGEGVFDAMVDSVKQYNKHKGIDNQSVVIALKRPVPTEIARVIGFLQYASLLLPKGEVSRGEKGTFQMYVLHYAALVDRNALFGRKAINIPDVVEAFSKRDPHEFTRVSPTTLIEGGLEENFSLSLPSCQVCHSPRVSEHAKFCQNCGAPLKTPSLFEALVSEDISHLPLTDARVSKIKEFSSIRSIKDVLIDHEHRELRSVPQIGPYWADRIYSYAEEYIA